MHKTLIIPDVHLKHKRVERIIEHEGALRVILLGDYFDDFGDDVGKAEDTAKWLSGSLWDTRRIHLIGNHETYYASDGKGHRCSGNDDLKLAAINTHMTPYLWSKLKFFHEENGILFSHAGIHNHYADRLPVLAEDEKDAFKAVFSGSNHWFLNAGVARGGRERYGGLVWRDANREYDTPEGLIQVFGHTPQVVYKKEDLWVSKNNLCLDTHLNHYATMIGSDIQIKEYRDL